MEFLGPNSSSAGGARPLDGGELIHYLFLDACLLTTLKIPENRVKHFATYIVSGELPEAKDVYTPL